MLLALTQIFSTNCNGGFMDYNNLVFYNGYGGFDVTTGEYAIDGSKTTPLAWSNVISCVSGYPFGFIITEKGDGFVWHYNSRENRLTPWTGKCTTTDPNEWVTLSLADEKSAASCRLICENDEIRHGFGYSSFYKEIFGLKTKVTVFVPEKYPVKLTLVDVLADKSDAFIDLDYYARTIEDEDTFVAASFDTHRVKIKHGERLNVVYMLGRETEIRKEKIIDTFRDYSFCVSELANVSAKWKELVGKIKIKSEDKEFDIMMNGWLAYQTISCRLFTRSSMYQSGGAYGYRDQLQDILCVNYLDSTLSRKQIILHASHQYSNGNVLHWWHPAYRDVEEFGIDSKYSDDMLWLVYITYKYVQNTGDTSVLTERVGYLDNHDSEDILFDHLVKSIEYACDFGELGLPLIKGGDWNDGMNNVGAKGKGQSIWLAFFLYCCLNCISALSKDISEKDYSFQRRQWQNLAKEIAGNIHKNAWDGKWYIRAVTDEGDAVGSASSEECKIDSISQSWSILSGIWQLSESFTARGLLAQESACDYLFNSDTGIVRLLWPPFSWKNIEKIGYIAAYPPGIRENGAYTHAAIWLARAMLETNTMRETGYKILKAVNPINHSRTSGECATYRVEPYVIAADIYSESRNIGRGGWSWYTGSASWYYTTLLESLFGFEKKGDYVEINSRYNEVVTISYKIGSSLYEFCIPPGAKGRYELVDDGKKHFIKV